LNSYISGAPNFKYKEFVKSYTATRFGIDNIPKDDYIWECIEKLAVNILQPVRNEFGPIRITSGYRTVELCEAVGSSAKSNHTRGQAADIEPYDDSIKLVDVVSFIYNKLDFRELILEYAPDGWVHVAFRDGGNIRKLLLKDTAHNYERVYIDDLKRLYG
jgi:hypothetical protein